MAWEEYFLFRNNRCSVSLDEAMKRAIGDPRSHRTPCGTFGCTLANGHSGLCAVEQLFPRRSVQEASLAAKVLVSMSRTQQWKEELAAEAAEAAVPADLRLHRPSSETGYKGVRQVASGRFQARHWAGEQFHILGTHATATQAAVAYARHVAAAADPATAAMAAEAAEAAATEATAVAAVDQR